MIEEIIVCDQNILCGKPTIKGTRISVEMILEMLAAGNSQEDLLAEYPNLTKNGILASLKFAANALRTDFVYPLLTKEAA